MHDALKVAKKKGSAGQLVRYGLVGIASNLSGYLIYLLITYWGVEPIKTMTLLYAIGASIGFIGNRQWAFSHNGNWWWAAVRYVIAHLVGYLINLFMLLIFAGGFGYPHQWVQGIAVFVVAGMLFLLFKYFVFPGNERGVE